MKFSLGYQVMDGSPDYFSDIVSDYRDHVREVYFAWPGTASGRNTVPAAALEQVRDELAVIAAMGVRLNMLFNASCYGGDAADDAFLADIRRQVDVVRNAVGLDAVTTMSPAIAATVREHYPELDVRASVNMRLGTVQAMEYVQDLFTSFYVQREFNRDPARLRELGNWAARAGKRLYALVNSGCLYACAAQTFHDNLVAHGGEGTFRTLCRTRLANPAHRADFLRATWIRPDDIVAHAKIFRGGYKLATRKHDNPRMVMDAYARGRFYGNLPDLMEPGFGPQWYPDVIDNARFPKDWFVKTTGCVRQCGACGYCDKVLEDATVRQTDDVAMKG